MSSSRIIVDTGPLVAFLAATEKNHAWAAEKFEELPAPFITCEAVLTEAFFLLSRLPGGAKHLFELLHSGLLEVSFSIIAEQESLKKLMQKYESLPMSLADACLVRLAELTPQATVFTLDSHFRIYRKNGRQQIPVICP